MSRAPNVLQTHLAAFSAAMDEAEKHRSVLRGRFGLTDQQIGFAVLARRGPKSRHPFAEYAAAVHAAQRKLGRN